MIAVFFLAGALAAWILARGRARQPTTPLGRVSALLLGVGIATAITLALTTAWDHHVQMLAYPGALLLVFMVAALNAGVRLRPLRWAAQAAGVAGVLLLLGVNHAPNAGWSLSRWTDPAHSRTAAALEAVRAARLAAATDVSYAHLGQNDEEGHAAFIGSGWTLACARFHQYPFTPDAVRSFSWSPPRCPIAPVRLKPGIASSSPATRSSGATTAASLSCVTPEVPSPFGNGANHLRRDSGPWFHRGRCRRQRMQRHALSS